MTLPNEFSRSWSHARENAYINVRQFPWSLCQPIHKRSLSTFYTEHQKANPPHNNFLTPKLEARFARKPSMLKFPSDFGRKIRGLTGVLFLGQTVVVLALAPFPAPSTSPTEWWRFTALSLSMTRQKYNLHNIKHTHSKNH